MLSWYHTLSDLRSSHKELTAGNYEEILHDDEQIYAFIRETGAAKAVVLMNFSEMEAEYDPSIVDGAKLLVSSANEGGTPGHLAPLESVIYEFA